MTDPKPYTDEDGRTLLIGACEDPRHVYLRVTDGEAVAEVCVSAADLPAETAKMRQAAGLPAPVILERPEIDPDAWLQSGPVRMGLTGDGEVMVGLGNAQSGAAPSDIRHIAALLCAYADAAEAEPNPADLEALTGLIDAEGVVPGRDLAGRLARSLLRGGVRMEARNEA